MKSFLRLFLVVFLISVGGLGFLLYKVFGKFDLSIIERTPPVIQITENSLGIGSEPLNFSLNVSDDGVGLDEVVVRIDQNGKVQDVLKKQYSPSTPADVIPISISGKEKGLKEGAAQILVYAFDKSFWNNSALATYAAQVDYTRPKLEVLTAQHNVAVGGMELVFYRLKSDDVKQSGVRIGTTEFPGFKASLLDKDFEKYPDVYFAFFALPVGFDKNTSKVSVFAHDAVGNAASSTMNYLIIPRKFRDADMKLSDDFLRKVFEELLPPFYKMQKKEDPAVDFDSLSDDEKRRYFQEINEQYRNALAQMLKQTFTQTEPQKLWIAPWERPLAAAPTSTFAEARKYFYKDAFASASLHAGVDLADVANAPVRPANAGKVVFADFGGIYGNMVIIDHGFGLTTLYGHLSSIQVNVGDMVQKGDQIARSGATGLAGGDHLHFEIRLFGVPVTPIEWWDSSWIREHIEKKIQGVKDQLQAQANLEAQIQGQ